MTTFFKNGKCTEHTACTYMLCIKIYFEESANIIAEISTSGALNEHDDVLVRAMYSW